jgi:UDP-N-acetylmuramate dehydrogenase
MIQYEVSLKSLNTFGIDAMAHSYALVQSTADIAQILDKHGEKPLLILGGGSNILLTKDFSGLVIKNDIQGFNIVEESAEDVIVEAGAGMNWHEFVMRCIDCNYGGVENLSLIPGNVGASPMQNIGAYGVEIKDVFAYLDAYHIKEKRYKRFFYDDCKFGYRESIFKNELKGQYLICKVALRLSKKHTIKTSYGAIENELEAMGIDHPTIQDVSQAVIKIRQSKLPDPNEIGNAGSFFKNPIVSMELLKKIKNKYADIPHYPAPDNKIKLAAGWLIEQSGWKGKTYDHRYGVHKLQALVLVNYKDAKGHEILALSSQIIEDVQQKFNVTLEREVNII